MNNDYKPLLPNKKIKTFRISDDSNSIQTYICLSYLVI